MKRFILGIILLLGVVPTIAQEVEMGPITLTYLESPLTPRHAAHGYTTVTLRVFNRDEVEHRVTLEMGNSQATWFQLNLVRRELVLSPGAKADVRLSFWTRAAPETYVFTYIDGVKEDNYLPIGMNLARYGVGTPNYISDYDIGLDSMDSEVTSKNEAPIVVAPEAWSTYWLDYTPYELIFVRAETWNDFSEEIRAALITWVRNGGALFFENEPRYLPKNLREGKQDGSFGRQAYLGFGQIMIHPGEIDPNNETLVSELRIQGNDTMNAISYTQNPDTSFPVVSEQDVPLRGFFGSMLLLVLIMGPVNIYVLTRRNKRIWLLATVPIISIATSVVIIAYAFFSEGFDTRIRRASFTILDQRSNLATTLAQQAIYAPLTSSEGLHFSSETEVHPYLDRMATRYRTLDWTFDQHLDTGWVMARIPAHFKHRVTETRRERVLIEPTSEGTVEVTNGLGQKITHMLYVDGSGDVWEVKDLETGGKTLAQATGASATSERPELWHDIFKGDWFNHHLNTKDLIQNRHTYMAQVERSPFLDEGPKKVSDWQENSFIYGILEVP